MSRDPDRPLGDWLLRDRPDVLARARAIRDGREPGSGAPQFTRAPSRRFVTLTRRRYQVLRGIADGKGNQEIGDDLGISVETVKSHARLVLAVLEARNRAHAVSIAYRKGILLVPDPSTEGEP